MGEIINLRLVKKRKAREAKDKTAAENRVLFGRTKTEKQFERNASRNAARFLDDNRLEPNDVEKPAESDADGK